MCWFWSSKLCAGFPFRKGYMSGPSLICYMCLLMIASIHFPSCLFREWLWLHCFPSDCYGYTGSSFTHACSAYTTLQSPKPLFWGMIRSLYPGHVYASLYVFVSTALFCIFLLIISIKSNLWTKLHTLTYACCTYHWWFNMSWFTLTLFVLIG